MVSEKKCRNTLKEGVQYKVHISQIFYRRSRRLARSSQVKTNHFLLAIQGLDGVTYVSVMICALHLLQLSWPLSGRFLLSFPHYDVGIIDSMLPCVCLVIGHRWRQNVIKQKQKQKQKQKTKKWHMSRRQMRHRMTYTYCLTVHVRGFGLV